VVSYKKLWHILLDRDLKKKDLVTLAGVSSYTVSKLSRGDNVTTDILQKICNALECNIGDIMDILPDEPQEKSSKCKSGRTAKR
jgi:DNA-binding Xre family transcriptional regulator